MEFKHKPDPAIYRTDVEGLPPGTRESVTVVADNAELNRRIAREFGDALAEKQARKEMLTIICPVGQVNYALFAQEIEQRGLDCRYLRTINMDEYLDDDGQLIDPDHPLSFQGFMQECFFSQLPRDNRPLPENIVFPDPQSPQKVTELIDAIGGADLCWAGFGITGHVAFNDPPHMVGEPEDLESFRNCKTRVLAGSAMSTAQMAIGGTHGNLDLVPETCVTLGMYELLKTRHYHMIFTRNWHQGLWRRALLGPVTSEFPGSLLQEHPNTSVTLTELAAKRPLVNKLQDTGEEAAA